MYESLLDYGVQIGVNSGLMPINHSVAFEGCVMALELLSEVLPAESGHGTPAGGARHQPDTEYSIYKYTTVYYYIVDIENYSVL